MSDEVGDAVGMVIFSVLVGYTLGMLTFSIMFG